LKLEASPIFVRMDYINKLLERRAQRGNLDTTKIYYKIQKVGADYKREEVGQFVRSYTMGSGDGGTIHWEFIKNGATIRVDDDLWGSLEGTELVGFIPKE
jgi:hypothetical protein